MKGRTLGEASLAGSVSGSILRLQSNCRPGWQSSQGFVRAGDSASELIHGIAGTLPFLTGWWPEASVPHQWASSWGGRQHGILLPQERKESQKEREVKGQVTALYNLISLSFKCNLYCIFFPWSSSPLTPSFPQQSPHCCPCPWVLFSFSSIPPPPPLPSLLAFILFSIYGPVICSPSLSLSPFSLLVQFVH